MSDTADLLRSTAALAIDYLDGVGDRPVGRPVAADRLRDALGRGPLPAAGEDPAQIVASLAPPLNRGWSPPPGRATSGSWLAAPFRRPSRPTG